MRIHDQTAYERCHERRCSEISGDTRGPFEAMHIFHRGIGGGGITCDINLVLGTRKEHHRGIDPHRLMYAVGRRYGVGCIQVEIELRRLQQLTKGSNPNDDRPSWAPEYPEASYRDVPTRKRRANNRTRKKVVLVPRGEVQRPSKRRKRMPHADQTGKWKSF